MKTPISYYGGKQTMVSIILPLIPEHNLYCEPFLGGAAVFFAKEKSQVEVINDKDSRVVNFYQMCKEQFHLLDYLIQRTPHSRAAHNESDKVLNNPDEYGPVYRAWAFWMQTNMSFASCIGAGFAYGRKKNSCEKKTANKKLQFTEEYKTRLDRVQIECNDAIKVITSRDSEESFFYCDPPYFNAHMGHYGGYTIEDFENLLKTLSEIKGKFLLSSYDSQLLQLFCKKNNWYQIKINKSIAISPTAVKKKTEVLTANYPIKLNK